MKRNLLMMFLWTAAIGYAQVCSQGSISENTGASVNISTGGNFEYISASDFDVPFGTIFTLEQVKFNALKGEADIEYLNVTLLEEFEGMPGDVIESFDNLIPTSQVFLEDAEGEWALYQITVELPSSIDFSRGKYFVQLQAKPGDDIDVGWEIATEEASTVGRFDFAKFDSDPWFGGFSYYDNVFEVIGTCTDSGEEIPNYGDVCSQGVPTNGHEGGIGFVGILVDDFIVNENTVFYLERLKISTLQLGNIRNANVKVRKAKDDGTPGDVIYSMEKKGPKTENFFGYWPISGFPLDVAAVELEFEFDEIIELTSGTYFVEISGVTPFPFTDILIWEGTFEDGIGGNAYISFDDGQTWEEIEGVNLVFEVHGYCAERLGIDDVVGASQLKYYPNPVKDELNITSNTAIKNVSIYNVSGRLVLISNDGSVKINTSALPSGVYIVKTELDNGRVDTFKMIKK